MIKYILLIYELLSIISIIVRISDIVIISCKKYNICTIRNKITKISLKNEKDRNMMQ